MIAKEPRSRKNLRKTLLAPMLRVGALTERVSILGSYSHFVAKSLTHAGSKTKNSKSIG
jgi:hypothetical protein